MQFRFEANQEFQQRAIASVVDAFDGMPRLTSQSSIAVMGSLITTSQERLMIDDERLLANIQTVQRLNGLPADETLELLTETVDVCGENRAVRFPNLSVEMETGTGKTYVYLRTALELNRRYGLKKFVIVVPSVAVREGVLKTFQVTATHFAELFDNEPYRFDVYDSRNLTRLKSFVEDDAVRFLIMTIDSFNKADNVIRSKTDRLMNGRTGLHLLQSVRPVIILDEPQNMESAGRKQALATLNPFAALRYSATHRNPYNRVYRLTPYDAYRQALVKKIEVAGVVEADSHNRPFMKIVDFSSSAKSVKVKIAVHKRMAEGQIKEKAFQFSPGDCLAKKADRSEYEAFVIDQIDIADASVTFENGVVLKEGAPFGAEQTAVFREQIRYTIEQHFRRQQQFDEWAERTGGERVKVLSLFFIDKVANYTAADGVIRLTFDELFDELKEKYPTWTKRKPEMVRGAYFAEKKRKGGSVELLDSKTGDSEDDKKAYALIMKQKEKLLSFDEPTAFLFSHSALKEGWDNPNVFQICTLNQTASEMKKRQEIGRGMRLAVGESGERLRDERVNVLTVVVNDSYESYVKSLQKEIAEDFGDDEANRTQITNALQKKKVVRKPLEELPEEFRELWERIKRRTRFRVAVDTEELIAHCIDDLNLKTIAPPRIEVTRARVEARGETFEPLQMSGAKTVASLAGRFPLPNLVELILELLAHTSATPVRLTRQTIMRIMAGIKQQTAIVENPTEFATTAANVIREKLEDQLVVGIQYEPDGTWFEQSLFADEFETSSNKVMESKKSLYDRFAYDSEIERKFATVLESRDDVRFYVKLPAWFKVLTPIGNYNPDWAIVMDESDQFGEKGNRLYLVRETKGSTNLSDLYLSQSQKIRCGARHFGQALDVNYRLIVKAEELPGGTLIK